MKLLIMQHGESVAKEIDPDRPLSTQGENDVHALAHQLELSNLDLQQIFHSGKTRARQTAEILVDHIAPAVTIETLPGCEPNDPLPPVKEIINCWEKDSLLVSHLPFVARLVADFITQQEQKAITAFVPGTIVCLEKENTAWQISWMLRPEIIDRGKL